MRTHSIVTGVGLVLSLAACTPPAPIPEPLPTEQQASQAVSEQAASQAAVASEPTAEEVEREMTQPEEGEDASGVQVDLGEGMTVKEEPAAAAPRAIDVTADNWLFSPSTIVVKRGEAVTLRLSGKAGIHGFTVPELGISQRVAAGQTVSVQLPTDRSGTFAIFCSIPCGSGHSDMRASIIIQD